MRHSYTKISMYMSCPAKKKYRYDDKLKEESHPAAQRGKDIHASFEEAIKDGRPLPNEFVFYADYVKTLRAAGAYSELKAAVNRSWEPCEFDSPDAWIISVLDLWLVRGTIAYGWDWKTGKVYDDHVKQKEFYSAVMLNTLLPEVEKVVFSNVYVDLQKAVPHEFTRSEILNLQARWGNRIALMERDTECSPTPNFFCRYCSFSKAKGGPCAF